VPVEKRVVVAKTKPSRPMPEIAIDFLGFFANAVFTILFSVDLMEIAFGCVSEPFAHG
jgi:hypothetical protein